jgi:hypothetical protein
MIANRIGKIVRYHWAGQREILEEEVHEILAEARRPTFATGDTFDDFVPERWAKPYEIPSQESLDLVLGA